jgi:Holliday junction resolvase
VLNTPYRRGLAAEKHVRGLLRAKGYTKVILSAASRTPIDMLASNGTTVLAVQVKQGGHFSGRGQEAASGVGWQLQG